MLRTQSLLTALVAALVIATPGRAQPTDASAVCEPVADTLRFGTGAVYRECAVNKPAKMKKSSTPNFQPRRFGFSLIASQSAPRALDVSSLA
jgi:hypothetical protein